MFSGTLEIVLVSKWRTPVGLPSSTSTCRITCLDLKDTIKAFIIASIEIGLTMNPGTSR